MFGEATYVATTSQLVVCIALVDENINANEEFIRLKDMPRTKSDDYPIVFQLKGVLQRMHLNIKKCHGQCYDGCSITSGLKKNGIEVQIKEQESRNQAVVDTVNSCPALKDLIDTTYDLAKLVKISPKVTQNLK